MVIAIGLSSYNIALFHLVNHAFYKGLLFLGAGAVIHAVADNQDFRKYGGLISLLPLTYSVILIASLSLVAFPFMTGFYSKDFILESSFGQYSFSSITIYIIAVIGAIFTTLYSVKVLYLTFLSYPNGPLMFYGTKSNNLDSYQVKYNKHNDGDIFLTLPLIILAIFSIFFGYLTKDIFIGLGSNFFIDNSIFIHPKNEILIDTEFSISAFIKLLPFIFTLTITFIAILILEWYPNIILNFKLSFLGISIYGFFNQRFLIEYFYNRYITNLVLKLGGQTTKILDKGSIEILGPYGLEKFLVSLSKSINKLNTSNIPNYGLYITIALISYTIMFYHFDLKWIIIFIFILTSILIKNTLIKSINNT